MKNKVDKSLEEVWEMKKASWEAFKNSSFSNYSEYIMKSTKELKEKYGIKTKYKSNPEKEKVLRTA